MRGITLFCLIALLCSSLNAQNVYTIKADSVKITNCDSSELIIENHTQGIQGFLFNTGNGRTIFKRAVQAIGGSSYLIGGDTLNLASRAWVQGGNSFGTTGILGTTDSNHLDFYTNNTFRGRLTATGGLLLGTTVNPFNDVLVAQGTATFGNGISLNYGDPYTCRLYAPSNLQLQSNAATGYQFYMHDLIGPVFTGPSVVSMGCGFSTLGASQGILQITGNGGLSIALFKTNGNTILGNTAAADSGQTLQVYGSSYFTGPVRLAALTQDSTKTQVLVSDASGNLYYRSASSLAADDLVRSSLAVNGPIKARKLMLSTGDWPDYVFDTAYHLPNLTDVQAYLYKEHHLPGIPSAAEVTKDSLDVGANQGALLKKIEELTLYTIEQDKKLTDQQKEMDRLKARLARLEEIINTKNAKQ